MATYSNTVTDDSGYRRPVQGVQVYTLNRDGSTALGVTPQPAVTDVFGFFLVTAPDGFYQLDYRLAGVSYAKEAVTIGVPPETQGPPGAADNTYSLTNGGLAAFKASDINRKTASLVGISGVPDGRFNWTPGSFTGQADDVNIIKADSTALSVGAWVRQKADGVAFQQAGSGAVLASTQRELRYFIRPEQFGAMANGTADDAPSIRAADAYAAATGATVLFDAKVYLVASKISKSYKTWWQGAGNPFPAINSGAVSQGAPVSGTQLSHDHGDTCVEMIGPGPYNQCGGIERMGIVGKPGTWATGDAWSFDQIGSARLFDLRSWSAHGDAFVIGKSAGDVTGQLHVTGLYANNPRGVCIRNRSKWVKMAQIETDGGTFSYYGDNAPNSDISQFHFEGASNKAVVFAGANGNTRLRGGFIALTSSASLKAIEVQSAVGNTDITISDVQIVGHPMLVAGIEVQSTALRARVTGCDISLCPIGVLDAANSTELIDNHFLSCGLPISAQGDAALYRGNRILGTTGSWSIDHMTGGNGVWSDNSVDKPIKPTLFGGNIGNFGSNRVVNNAGYKTRSSGLTASITTGTAIPHGLSVTPYIADVRRLGQPDPADLAWTFNATNIVPTWSGGTAIQFEWTAQAVCEGS